MSLENVDISKQFCLTYWSFGKKMTKECFSSHHVAFHFGLEHVSIVKTKSQKFVVTARKKPQGAGFPPAEIGLNCCKKLYTVTKKLVDFSLLINFTARKCICIVLGD